ncbi:MAG: hypothetical protein K8S54_19400 [Spirochaetia bacterium]|nr:hypothetical protein [Spirochaetia bacterium]
MKLMKNISIGTIALALLMNLPLIAQVQGPAKVEGNTTSQRASAENSDANAGDASGQKEHKEYEIGDRQAVDVYGSLEDGTPGAPGESEMIVSGGWMNSREARNTFGGGIEFGHTFSGNKFLENMQLGVGIEGERADMMNENRLSYQNLSWFLAGRQRAGGSIDGLTTQLNDFLLGRNLVDSFFREDLRPLGYYNAGQILTQPPIGAPIAINQASILNYQQGRLVFDPHAAGEIFDSYRLQTKKRKSESAGEIAPSWLQRWVSDHGPDSFIPTISTVAEIGFPLTDKAAAGETATLTIATLKTFEFGTLIGNVFGTAVVGNADRTLRSSIYGGRVGFRKDFEVSGAEEDYRFNLVTALVHEMSEVRHEPDSTTLEIGLQFDLGNDMSIGPGIAIGLDHHEATPRFSFGATMVF